jgi:hypothetical protein
VDCQGIDATRTPVDADDDARRAADVDDGLPYLGDHDEWIRDFLAAYFSAWGRVARLAGATEARADASTWKSVRKQVAGYNVATVAFSDGQASAYDVQAQELRILARVLRVAS